MKFDEGIINYAVYKNGEENCGIAEVTLPDIARITQEIKGAGIMGTFNSPVMGSFEAMTMTLNFRTPRKEQFSLLRQGEHLIDLRAAQQVRDTVTGEIKAVPVKHIMKVTAVKHSNGKVATASTADGSGEYAVSYYATYIDGEKLLEIDIFNNVCVIDGVDEMAAVRSALGK